VRVGLGTSEEVRVSTVSSNDAQSCTRRELLVADSDSATDLGRKEKRKRAGEVAVYRWRSSSSPRLQNRSGTIAASALLQCGRSRALMTQLLVQKSV
jgi:hypothetical protein